MAVGVDFQSAKRMTSRERKVYTIVLGMHKGGTFDFKTGQWVKTDAASNEADKADATVSVRSKRRRR